MDLKESEASIDKGLATVACSICLEIVTGGGDRSTARLLCGHEFHLDCIGSAFNVKGGVMQCPNCRKVEKGNWLGANGSRTLPELSFDDWTHDEDLYDISYTEMAFGIHWCPFSGFRMPSSFESSSRIPAPSLAPPYLTNSQPHGHVRAHHYPLGPHGTMYPDSHRQGPTNGLPPPVGPTPPALPDHPTYYLFPPPPSSSRSHQDVENTGDRFYAWERDQFTPFPLIPQPVDRESGNWWGPLQHPLEGLPDSGVRAGFWQRSGSSQGRAEATSHRLPHSTRTRHYI